MISHISFITKKFPRDNIAHGSKLWIMNAALSGSKFEI